MAIPAEAGRHGMEKTVSNLIWRDYHRIVNQGLSAGLDPLERLLKFQHSVSYHEALLSLELLFRLCDRFRCQDVTELTALSYIHEYWCLQEQINSLPSKIAPRFEITENKISCTRAEKPLKGCLRCHHFNACIFPREVLPDDLGNAQWRCVACGNALEFPTIMYEAWVMHQQGVTAQFLCCACFMEYSCQGDFSNDAIKAADFYKMLTTSRVSTPASILVTGEASTEEIYLMDLFTVFLSLVSTLKALFEDPNSHLYYKIVHPASSDNVIGLIFQLLIQYFKREDFARVTNLILPRLGECPRLSSLFEYCIGNFAMEDFLLLEDADTSILSFSPNFRDFICVFVQTNLPQRILDVFQQSPATWDQLTLWVEDQFI